MGPLMISHISMTTSRYLRPLLATSDGFVVMPSMSPRALASRTSATSPVSMKNFMMSSSPRSGGWQGGLGRLARGVRPGQALLQHGQDAEQALQAFANIHGFGREALELRDQLRPFHTSRIRASMGR